MSTIVEEIKFATLGLHLAGYTIFTLLLSLTIIFLMKYIS